MMHTRTFRVPGPRPPGAVFMPEGTPVTWNSTSAMRPCGCDWDTTVFGHAYCWNTLGGFPKHVTCGCLTCTCDCHTWTGDHGTDP